MRRARVALQPNFMHRQHLSGPDRGCLQSICAVCSRTYPAKQTGSSTGRTLQLLSPSTKYNTHPCAAMKVAKCLHSCVCCCALSNYSDLHGSMSLHFGWESQKALNKRLLSAGPQRTETGSYITTLPDSTPQRLCLHPVCTADVGLDRA
jgi:hypothetical protein